MYANLPNSCLLGIILTISTHSGPQLIYHYPPTNYATAVKSKKRHQSKAKKYQYTDSESDSTTEDYTSGLSDSELSTDYIDYSSEESDASLESFSLLLPEDAQNSSINNSINNGLRSRQSQISANKIFQLLNSNNNSNNNTIINGEHSLRESLHSIKTTTNLSSTTTELRVDEEFEALMNPELKSLVDELLDDSVFQQDSFQDFSKIFNFNTEFIAEFCSPPKEMCNTRFEFTVDDLCFLGLPIHSDAKGRWRKAKKKKHSSKKSAKNSGRRRSYTETHSTTDQEQLADDEHTDNEASFEIRNVLWC